MHAKASNSYIVIAVHTYSIMLARKLATCVVKLALMCVCSFNENQLYHAGTQALAGLYLRA